MSPTTRRLLDKFDKTAKAHGYAEFEATSLEAQKAKERYDRAKKELEEHLEKIERGQSWA